MLVFFSVGREQAGDLNSRFLFRSQMKDNECSVHTTLAHSVRMKNLSADAVCALPLHGRMDMHHLSSAWSTQREEPRSGAASLLKKSFVRRFFMFVGANVYILNYVHQFKNRHP
jgi:hypothetical protein